MKAVLALIDKALPYILAVLAVLAIAFGGFRLGVTLTNATWQSTWDNHIAADTADRLLSEASARTEEQRRQQTINKVIQDGQKQIDMARADADASDAHSGRLRDKADRIAKQLADSEAGRSACSTAASKATAHYARVLADVFKRADERAGKLAAVADQSRTRGLMCERSFDAIGG